MKQGDTRMERASPETEASGGDKKKNIDQRTKLDQREEPNVKEEVTE